MVVNVDSFHLFSGLVINLPIADFLELFRTMFGPTQRQVRERRGIMCGAMVKFRRNRQDLERPCGNLAIAGTSRCRHHPLLADHGE